MPNLSSFYRRFPWLVSLLNSLFTVVVTTSMYYGSIYLCEKAIEEQKVDGMTIAILWNIVLLPLLIIGIVLLSVTTTIYLFRRIPLRGTSFLTYTTFRLCCTNIKKALLS